MKDCPKKRKITGSVQEKNGMYYIVLNLYVDGKRRPKWMPTGLPVKGYNKRKAEDMKEDLLYSANNDGKLPNATKKVVVTAADMHDRMARNTDVPKTGFPGDNILLVDYFKQWIERMRHMVKENTWEGYNANMQGRILPYFEQFDFTLSSLEPYDVQTFYDHCLASPRLDGHPGKISSTTLRRCHAVMSKSLRDAAFNRLIKTSPVTAVITPPNNQYSANFHSADAIGKILMAAKGDICEVPLTLMYLFGIRRSEALGLKLDAIDFENGSISIRHTVVPVKGSLLCKDITKTKKSRRTLPLIPGTEEYIKKVVEKVQGLQALFGPKFNPQGYICINNDGSLIYPTTVTKHNSIVLEKAGLPAYRLHDSRHSVASLLVANGCNMKEIQLWLGHSDIATTGNLYSHLGTDGLKNASEKISSKISLPISNDVFEPIAS